MSDLQQYKLPHHLLILRLAASCDVAMLPHAVRALRKAYPELQITVATRSRFESFFRGLGVDIMPINMGDEPLTLRQKWQFVRRTKRIGVDAVADLHFIANSVLLGLLWRLCGVKVSRIRKGSIEKWFRVGYSREGALHLKHTAVRYCDVFRRLGFEIEDPEYPQRSEVDSAESCVGFAPFAAHSCCTCPEKLREEIMERLTARFDKVYVFEADSADAAQYHDEVALIIGDSFGGFLSTVAKGYYKDVYWINTKIDGFTMEMVDKYNPDVNVL